MFSNLRYIRKMKRFYEKFFIRTWNNFCIIGFRAAFFYFTGQFFVSMRNRYYPILRNYLSTIPIKSYLDFSKKKRIAKENNKIVWIMWWQGEMSAPPLVKACINSIRQHASGKTVILIDKDNIGSFITLPNFIENKVKDGSIDLTRLSDILRYGLLAMYGGVWIDATIFVVKDLPEDIWNRDFYSITVLQTNRNIFLDKFSTFFVSGKERNIFFEYMYNALLSYWEYVEVSLDYFIADSFAYLSYMENADIKSLIDSNSPNNKGVFNLIDNGNKPYSVIDRYIDHSEDAFCYKFNNKKHYRIRTLFGERTIVGKILDDGLLDY